MKLPAGDRPALTESTNPGTVSERITESTIPHLPREAIILDEDVNSKQFIRELRSRQLTYSDGRPGLGKFSRIQIVAAAHLFETTEDKPLLNWCEMHGYLLVTANREDFVELGNTTTHSGILIVADKNGLVNRTTAYGNEFERIFDNLSKSQIRNQIVRVDP